MAAGRPQITSKEIAGLVPGATIVGESRSGGQKTVVPIRKHGKRLALKVFWLPPELESDASTIDDPSEPPEEEEAVARARRDYGRSLLPRWGGSLLIIRSHWAFVLSSH